jgi:hypothetical protein
MSDLGGFLAGLASPGSTKGVIYGTVTALDPLTVRFGSDIEVPGVKKCGPYVPAVGDVVAVWQDGPARLVLGNVS